MTTIPRYVRIPHKKFMDIDPPIFIGQNRGEDVNEWLWKITIIFQVLQVPDEHKVDYDTYHLQDAAQHWWESTKEIWLQDATITWHLYEWKSQEFADLQQGGLLVEEYMSNF